MFDFITSKRKKITSDLLDIEDILQSSLKPISPRPEFIQNLHRGLMEYTFSRLDSEEFDIKKSIIILVAGFVSLIFVLSLWIRLILVIISTLGMIQTTKGGRKAG